MNSAHRLSDRARALQPSATMALDAKAKALKRQGVPVVSLAVGEPDFDTPDAIKAAGIRALEAGFTKYTEPAGIPELREAVAAKFLADYGLTVAPDQVCVTTGAKQAIFNALQVLLNPGDEVLVPLPCWVSYPEMVALTGAKAVGVKWTEGFQIDLDDLKSKISPRTRMILLNTPNNPTGAVYPRKTLETLAGIALKQDILLLSDEIYEKLVFGGETHTALASLSGEVAERTLTVNGCSKAYAMTGWRLGYAVGPKEIISAMVNYQSQSTSCAAGFVQKAAVEALRNGAAAIPPMVAAFDKRRKAVLGIVRTWPGTQVAEPKGAYYLFPDLSSFLRGGKVRDDLALSECLLNEVKVAVVPGTPFGAPGHLRLSTAAAQDVLEKACRDIGLALKRLA